jgi:hypothetical protein
VKLTYGIKLTHAVTVQRALAQLTSAPSTPQLPTVINNVRVNLSDLSKAKAGDKSHKTGMLKELSSMNNEHYCAKKTRTYRLYRTVPRIKNSYNKNEYSRATIN